ncbi:hypothetical protein HOY80DRAFT_1057835 [Tuber brumale]|nr:hypothetical protein HOY80DRAFT_1057835 [Tuber brumale]
MLMGITVVAIGGPNPSSIQIPAWNIFKQVVLIGEDFNITSPPKSEESVQFLGFSASSPIDRFSFTDLQSRTLRGNDEVVWHILLVYFRAFNFDKQNPAKFLTILNYMAAACFHTTILFCFGLLGSMQDVVRCLVLCGNIIGILSGYQKLMVDSFPIAILENPGLDPQVMYEVTNQGRTPGMVDLIIISLSHCAVTEWKMVVIDFLDLGDSLSWDKKAEAPSQLNVIEVLELKFHRREKYKKGTIHCWIEKDIASQLKSYVLSPEIRGLAGLREFQAHLVLVVGSCKILV